jgi:hypothetical protein
MQATMEKMTSFAALPCISVTLISYLPSVTTLATTQVCTEIKAGRLREYGTELVHHSLSRGNRLRWNVSTKIMNIVCCVFISSRE